MISGVGTWQELGKPAIVGGFLAQLAVLIGSVFAGAPKDPKLTEAANPGRRAGDPTATAAKLIVLLVLFLPGGLTAFRKARSA